MESRFGTFMFDVPGGEFGEEMFRLFSLVIPLRVEHLFTEQRFIVTGYSFLFDEIEEGDRIPDYRISFTPNGIKAERQ